MYFTIPFDGFSYSITYLLLIFEVVFLASWGDFIYFLRLFLPVYLLTDSPAPLLALCLYLFIIYFIYFYYIDASHCSSKPSPQEDTLPLRRTNWRLARRVTSWTAAMPPPLPLPPQPPPKQLPQRTMARPWLWLWRRWRKSMLWVTCLWPIDVNLGKIDYCW